MWHYVFQFCLIFSATIFIRKGTEELIDIVKYPYHDMRLDANTGIIFNKKKEKQIIRILRDQKLVKNIKDVEDVKTFIYNLFVKCVCEMCAKDYTSIDITEKYNGVNVLMSFDDVKSRVAVIKIGESRGLQIDYNMKDIDSIVTVYAIQKFEKMIGMRRKK